MTLIYNSDLQWRDLPVTPKPAVVLWCPACGSIGPACRGFYRMIDPDATIRCGLRNCDGYMRLARQVVKFEILDPQEAEQ